MQIDNLLLDMGSSDYYDPSFRATLEAHMPFLRQSSQTTTLPVPEFATIVYNQDLFGYLVELKLPLSLHWVIMRMNNFYGPYDFDSRCTSLLIPSARQVDILRQSWNSKPVITA